MKVVNANVAAVFLLLSSLSDAGRSINADAIMKKNAMIG
jgi:hypothetical protein